MFAVACDSSSSESEDGSSEEEEDAAPVLTQDDAIAYNDMLVALDNAAWEAFTDYESAIYDGEVEGLAELKDELEAAVAAGYAYADADEDFDGEFEASFIGMFDAYTAAIDNYLPIMVEYWTTPYEETTEEMEISEEQAYNEMYEIIEAASDDFIETQEEFAAEWDFILE